MYVCPQDESGNRLGPLVAYAGTYGTERLPYVGDVYVNMAVMERDMEFMSAHARYLLENKPGLRDADIFCGAPEGGKTLAVLLARERNRRYVYPEYTADKDARSKSFAMRRHDGAVRGKRVVIVEDVMNNFSTTAALISLLHEQGGEVIGITGMLNRSLTVTDSFGNVPVSAVVHRPIEEYRQDDPRVVHDVERGNIVMKPKHEWERLMQVMQMHPKTAPSC